MDPKVIRFAYESDGSVPKCPICSMPLSLRTKGKQEPLPEGVTARVQLSPDRIQLAGVQTIEVQYRPMTKQVTTVGAVTFDESRLSRVVSRVTGYVEKLYVDTTFVQVNKGDPLAEIYSPELYSTAQEMLLASRGAVSSDLAASARKRLKLFGVGDKEIDDIVAAGAATPRLVIRSPQSGHVIRKNVVVGTRVEDGMTLLEIADLSSVWIEADVFEKDIALLREGQAVRAIGRGDARAARSPAKWPWSIRSWTRPRAPIACASRWPIREADLRPGMFATVEIQTPLGQIEPFRSLLAEHAKSEGPAPLRTVTGPDNATVEEVLAVPERSVIDTGTKQIVYVEREPGMFEGVEVRLGPAERRFLSGGQGAARRPARGGGRLVPDRRGDAAQPGGSRGLLRRQRRSGRQRRRAGQGRALGTAGRETAAADRLGLGQHRTTAGDRPRGGPGPGRLPRDRRPLGTMGVPPKLMVKGRPVFVCCRGCTDAAMNNADEMLEKVEHLKKVVAEEHAEIGGSSGERVATSFPLSLWERGWG